MLHQLQQNSGRNQKFKSSAIAWNSSEDTIFQCALAKLRMPDRQTMEVKYVVCLQWNCRNRVNSIFRLTLQLWKTDRAAVFSRQILKKKFKKIS